MLHSTTHLLNRNRVELSEAEVKLAIVEFIANRRPHACPPGLAYEAKAMLEAHGTKVFSIHVEEQDTRNGEPGEKENVTIVKFDYDVRTP